MHLQVYSGQKAIFKIKVVKKDRGAWSIGIVSLFLHVIFTVIGAAQASTYM